MMMNKKVIKYFLILAPIFFFGVVNASETVGTIDSSYHTAQVCENTACTVTSTSGINFGYFTTSTSSNVVIIDSELTGYIWGESFGWAVLNCSDTVSGCSATNGSFKVANDGEGNLSGYAWGENAGWINFGPFYNSSTSSVTINSDGEFNGYAWSENYGWIKFDSSDSDYTVKTDWRPISARSSGGGGTGVTTPPATPPTTPPATPPTTPPTTPPGPITAPPTTPPTTPPGPTTTPPTTPPGTGTGTGTGTETGIGTGTGTTTGTGGFIGQAVGFLSSAGKSAQQSFSYFNDEFSKTKDEVAEIINSPTGDIVTKTVTTAGVISGATISVASALFLNPLSFSELFLIPIRLWGLLMAALGIRKKNKPWGTVYDSVTKQPIDPAYVTLQDLEGNEVATSITDLDGRFGFMVPAGTYRLVANKTNYKFPSDKIAGKNIDEIYQDLYFGNIVEITEDGGVIAKNIPMDPLKFDWNEFEKKEQKLMKFYSKRNIVINKLADFLFDLGLVLTIIAVIAAPKPYNIITLVIYAVLFVLKHTILKPRPFGTIKEKNTGNPLSFAIAYVYNADSDREVVHKVTNKMGHFYCLVPNGRYYVKIKRKNSDESYTEIFTSNTIEVKKGFINSHFKV
ncbi:MAG: carboxypeptidase-like regulatory domain-containing protein [Patescibacteria group bacterium]|nr:carboxypeptidase-like regulatory domain-containing protein [Patescibacteria group bacterium]